jgi:Cu(I)/Ag(I) efflux system membrane fusion protein
MVMIALGLIVSACAPPSVPTEAPDPQSLATARATDPLENRPLYYRHPMNPSITSPTPAKDEMGMDFTPVYDTSQTVAGEVRLTDSFVQKLGVRIMPVAVGTLSGAVRAPGVIQFDSGSVTEAYVIVTGRVEKLSVGSVGEAIRSGQLLFEVYSPALETVDVQYLQSLDASTPNSQNPYVNGLRAFGLTDDLIADLREKRRPVGRLPVRARRSGVVTALNFRSGAIVSPGDSVLQWAATDPVWAIVQVPASQAPYVKKGQSAEVTSPALNGGPLSASVSYVYPDADPRTGAVPVRLVLPNRDGELKPNTLVSALIHGSESGEVIHVPREAVIRDGRVDRVILALGDGRFVPREVELGRESGDRLVVLKGLGATDQVVTSGVFLIDAESSIRSSLARMGERPAVELTRDAAAPSSGGQ